MDFLLLRHLVRLFYKIVLRKRAQNFKPTDQNLSEQSQKLKKTMFRANDREKYTNYIATDLYSTLSAIKQLKFFMNAVKVDW